MVIGKGQLKKSLGLADVFCISAGAMISSGIFILPGISFANIGPAVFLAYLLAGLCVVIGSLATIELATAMPLAGGIYYYTGRSLGPLAGTVSGLLNWSAIALKSSFAIFGMSEIIYQFTGINTTFSGVILTFLFLGVNLIGTKEAAWAQIVMVLLLFAVMGSYIIFGFNEVDVTHFSPLFRKGTSVRNLVAEAAFVFVAFGGLLDVASVSEEVKNPKRNLPLGMLGATIAVIVIYVLTLIVTVGVMEPSKLAGSLSPLADAAGIYYGKAGYFLIVFGAAMAFVTTANAGVMAAARFPFAMGRDKLIPEAFSRTVGKRRIPLSSLLITGTAMAVAQFLPLEYLVTVASTVIMLSFILTNISVIILRESGLQNYSPSFRMPLYPVTPILSMLVFAVMVIELGVMSMRVSVGIIIAGIVLYAVFGRKVSLEYALVHLVSRITRRRMSGGGNRLEKELREIVRARDNVVTDEIDAIFESAEINVLNNERLPFARLARKITGNSAVASLLIKREMESSTAISESVAIPHITVPGKDVFSLVVAKCPNGTVFPNHKGLVKAVFFLVSSHDKRNLHLRMLAAIAQTIQSPSFALRWEKAKTPDELRELLLMSKRRRTQAN